MTDDVVRLIFCAQVILAAMMTGLIWFVQVVHYPLFVRIPPASFTDYERSHTTRTGVVVAPIMLTELVTAVALPLSRTSYAVSPLYMTSLGCLLLIWISTFLVQVPLHAMLEKNHCPNSIRRLVLTNWIRTILWSLRSVFLLLILKFGMTNGLLG